MYLWKRWAFALGLASILPLSTTASLAQLWPQRAVHIIVPIAPGSSLDVAARAFAERLAVRWKQPVVVENRVGADGLTGTIAFASAKDDHTLLFMSAAPLSIYPVLQEKLPYDPGRDVLPISTAVETFGTIAVPASQPTATLSEFVQFARTRPGKLNWSTGGGAFPVLMTGFFKSAGVETTHIPYRNQNLALQDVAESRLQVFATAMTAVLPLIQAGKIRALALTNNARAPFWPEIPTAIESGFPELAFEGLLGLFAPRGIPEQRRARIAAEVRAVVADETVASRLAAVGLVVRGSTPGEFVVAIEKQRAAMAAIVERNGKPTQ